MEFFNLPETIYDTLLEYLTDKTIENLTVACCVASARVSKLQSSNYYWVKRISNALGINPSTIVIPNGIAARDVYENMGSAQDKHLIAWLTGKDEADYLLPLVRQTTNEGNKIGVYLLGVQAKNHYNASLPVGLPDPSATKYVLKSITVDLSEPRRKTHVQDTLSKAPKLTRSNSTSIFVHGAHDVLLPMEYYDIRLIVGDKVDLKPREVMVFKNVVGTSYREPSPRGVTLGPVSHPIVENLVVLNMPNLYEWNGSNKDVRDFITNYYAMFAACRATGMEFVGMYVIQLVPYLSHTFFFLAILCAWVAEVELLDLGTRQSMEVDLVLYRSLTESRTPLEFVQRAATHVHLDPETIREVFATL